MLSRTGIEDFLNEAEAHEISWSRPESAPASLATERVLIAAGPQAFEVAIASATIRPRVEDVRRLWALRWNRRAAPVVLVVCYPTDGTWKTAVCGTKDDPAVLHDLSLDQVERICTAALEAPDSANAERTLHRLLSGLKDQLVAGLLNSGLFASHELRHGVPTRTDWASAQTKGVPLLRRRGVELIRGLGYSTTPHGSTAVILSASGDQRAVGVLLDEMEMFDRPTARLGAVSPVALGLAIAQEQGLPWLVITRDTQIRLYSANPDIGVGRKGQAETFVEIDMALLAEVDAAYLPLLFSADALTKGGSVPQILEASADHAAALGRRLRERVYKDVVPQLATAVARRMKAVSEAELAEAYHRTLIILFRLLFTAYAEDRGLLPYLRNPRYTAKALKTLAREFAEKPEQEFDAVATDRWDDLLTVWRAVDDGNTEWGVPAYNGGLFASGNAYPASQAIADLRLTNNEIGPALRALLVDTGEDGTVGPVDFRSLSVREFGTIYEGLLESSLSIAPGPLAVDPKTKAYIPARTTDEVVVAASDVYFHNASGARKSTGSYFTKAFVVEHLLDTSLTPVLTEHLARVKALLDAGDEAKAAETFFDFRVADLAMGSGHFLVAAIDRIENKFSAFLTAHPIPDVNDELYRLADAARAALGTSAPDIEIEPSALLRRQIARRCIYGLDLNLMAVELARLAIWIHTFVPGLPMSTLDHGLVVGNSLTGMATIEEVIDVFDPQSGGGTISLFEEQIIEQLAPARDLLRRVARTSEATRQEVKEAKKAHAEALKAAADATPLFDAAVATRLGLIDRMPTPQEAVSAVWEDGVKEGMRHLKAAHLPILFPEVFLRDRPGFDVLLGNPPWEEVTVEKLGFWALRFPGLKSLPAKAQNEKIAGFERDRPDLVAEYEAEVSSSALLRQALLHGPFPGIGKGDPDLYKAFTWRIWQTLRSDGAAGVVLPRSALSAAGSAEWREKILTEGTFSDVTLLRNSAEWVFDEIDPRYTVGLIGIRKGADYAGRLRMRGPFVSLREYRAHAGENGVEVATDSFLSWSEGAAFPAIPDSVALGIFAKMRQQPRLDTTSGTWRARPATEFHATSDKKKGHFSVDLDGPSGWPVYKGASFDLWNPDTGTYYGWADPAHVTTELRSRRTRQARKSTSAFAEFAPAVIRDASTLPCLHPRIMLRDITRSNDSRTVRVALVPANVVATNSAPYLLFPRGNEQDEAYLLGVLSSIPLDWLARTVVENHLNFHILNGLPIPRPEPGSVLREHVIQIAGQLAAVDGRYTDWAAKVGVPVGSATDEATKNDLIAELDAVVALLFGLDRDDVSHIFATFHRTWDSRERLSAVLTHYDLWKAWVES
ncbi:Eco57I restriction-modification methylase domain-containing protein [Streptomyces sp. NPDC088337]|uniref:Eco57I restriction-modification methylase domain-containing protein n=1 Tax=unclassified Streptomyces TaxID=2593676 RepID=UPI003811F5B1